MSRRISLILILCWTCVAFGHTASSDSPQPTAPPPLSLAEAVNIALQQHPALKEAEAAVDAAEAEVRVSRSSYFPQLSFSGIGKVGLSGATSLGLPGFPASPFFRNTAYSVNWYQSIFDFGRTKHLVAMNRALARNELFRKTSEEQRIVLAVKRAYFAVLEAQRLEQAGRSTVNEQTLTVERAKAYYQAELGSKLDLSLAEASLAEAQGTLIHSHNAVFTSFAALRAAMGVGGTQMYSLQTPPTEIVSLRPLEDLVQEATRNRPDEQALAAKINAFEENFGLARSQSFPEIRGFGAGGQGRFNGTTIKENQRHGVGALGVLLPIFTGGRLKAVRDEARADLAGAIAARDALHQQIRLEVAQAYYQIADLAERIKVADQQQKAAQEALSLAQARYQVQLGSFLDVLTAQVAATGAQTNYARTQFDYERAKAQLDFATGKVVRP